MNVDPPGSPPLPRIAVTEDPHIAWVVQQFREAAPFGEQPRYPLRDNDGIYGHGVPQFLKSCGIKQVQTAYRSPRQNPFCERVIRTLRRELLDHVIVVSEGHLQGLLKEFVEEYHHPTRPLDGCGLRDHLLARPVRPALYPVPVRRVAAVAPRFLQTPPRDDALALR